MVRPHTRPTATTMPHSRAVGDRAVRLLPSSPLRPNIVPLPCESPVAGTVQSASPQPAVAGLVNLGPKPLRNGGSCADEGVACTAPTLIVGVAPSTRPRRPLTLGDATYGHILNVAREARFAGIATPFRTPADIRAIVPMRSGVPMPAARQNGEYPQPREPQPPWTGLSYSAANDTR